MPILHADSAGKVRRGFDNGVEQPDPATVHQTPPGLGSPANQVNQPGAASGLDAINRILGGLPDQFVKIFSIRPLDTQGNAVVEAEETRIEGEQIKTIQRSL